MEQHRLSGNPSVEITLRRSARARRLTLRVSSLDGRVTLTVPRGVSDREAMAFAESRGDWLRRNVARTPDETRAVEEATIPFDGSPHVIRRGDVASVRAEGGVIWVPARSRAVPRAVEAFVKHSARDALAEAVERYGARLGRRATGLALRDTRSRWGSCTAEGRVMLSWRLMLAPRAVRDYVAAHEVAHLAHMDHSRAFWDTVARIHGPHDSHRQWLRHHGPALHRIRFDG